MMASGRAVTTASRSSSIRPVCSPLTRTRRRGRVAWAAAALTNPAASPRARAFCSGAIESSRSTMMASAPLAIALSSFLPPSAGTNRYDRIAADFSSLAASSAASLVWSFGPHADEGLAAALGNELVVLIVGAVVELDDAGTRSRLRLALGDHLGGAVHGVVLEQRVGEFDLCHAEVGDCGA